MGLGPQKCIRNSKLGRIYKYITEELHIKKYQKFVLPYNLGFEDINFGCNYIVSLNITPKLVYYSMFTKITWY